MASSAEPVKFWYWLNAGSMAIGELEESEGFIKESCNGLKFTVASGTRFPGTFSGEMLCKQTFKTRDGAIRARREMLEAEATEHERTARDIRENLIAFREKYESNAS